MTKNNTICTLAQVARDSRAGSTNGNTTYRFVALPTADGSYGSFVKPEELPGAIVLERHRLGSRAADRHSKTRVECELLEGTILKTVLKPDNGGRSETSVEILRHGELTDEAVRYVGATKLPTGAWATVIAIDDQRVTIAG